MHLFSTIKKSLAFLKMNAYMHLLSKRADAQSRDGVNYIGK